MKVLREILRNQPARFKNYAELTIMKTLEAHKDPHKEVSKRLCVFCVFEDVTHVKAQIKCNIQRICLINDSNASGEVIGLIVKDSVNIG